MTTDMRAALAKRNIIWGARNYEILRQVRLEIKSASWNRRLWGQRISQKKLRDGAYVTRVSAQP